MFAKPDHIYFLAERAARRLILQMGQRRLKARDRQDLGFRAMFRPPPTQEPRLSPCYPPPPPLTKVCSGFSPSRIHCGDSWPGCAGNPSHLHRNHSSQTGVAMRGERKVGNVPVWGLSWTSLGGLGALDSRRSDQQILILYLRCLLQAST